MQVVPFDEDSKTFEGVWAYRQHVLDDLELGQLEEKRAVVISELEEVRAAHEDFIEDEMNPRFLPAGVDAG
jgi:hypothetical protein